MKMRRMGWATAGMFCLSLTLCIAAVRPAFAAEQAKPTASGENSAPNGVVPAKEEQEKDEKYEYTHSPTVEKLGHMLGMSTDTAATTFTVLNFVVLLIGVGYLMLKM